MSSAAEEDTQRVDSMRRKALVLEEMMQQASGTKDSSDGEVGTFQISVLLPSQCIPLMALLIGTYRVGRPIVRKVLKIRIWAVPPVCLGRR